MIFSINDIQHKELICDTLTILYKECHYAECLMLSVGNYCIVMLNAIMLSVVVLSVVMLNVVALLKLLGHLCCCCKPVILDSVILESLVIFFSVCCLFLFIYFGLDEMQVSLL